MKTVQNGKMCKELAYFGDLVSTTTDWSVLTFYQCCNGKTHNIQTRKYDLSMKNTYSRFLCLYVFFMCMFLCFLNTMYMYKVFHKKDPFLFFL